MGTCRDRARIKNNTTFYPSYLRTARSCHPLSLLFFLLHLRFPDATTERHVLATRSPYHFSCLISVFLMPRPNGTFLFLSCLYFFHERAVRSNNWIESWELLRRAISRRVPTDNTTYRYRNHHFIGFQIIYC